MPRLNLYEQQTTLKEARADSYAMGMAPAQALENFGNSLTDIRNRVQKREELGVSQHVMENADEMAQTALTDLGKRQDINSPKAMQDFEEAMQQIRQNGLMQFAGSADGRAALERQLDNQLSQYRKSAVATKIKAGQEQMGRVLDQQFNKSIMQVDVAPDVWSFARDEILDIVETWKPAMSKDQYEQAKRLAHAKPIQAAVRSYQAQGDYEAADKLMNDPENIQFMTVDELRPLRIDNAVGKGKIAKEQREFETNVAQWESIAGPGVKFTLEQKKALPKFSSVDAAEKIAGIQAITGTPLTIKQKQMLFGLDNQNKETQKEWLAANAYRYNEMSPEEQLKFQATAESAHPPKITTRNQFGDTVTEGGVPEVYQRIMRGEGLPTIRNLSGTRPVTGFTDGGTAESVAAEQIAIMREERSKPGNSPETNASLDREIARLGGTTVAGGKSDDSKGSAAPARPDDSAQVNLYDRAGDLTGVVSGVKRLAGKLPSELGGDLIDRDPVFAKATQAAEVIQKEVVEGFMNAGKDAQQFREQIESIVTIKPQVFRSTDDYRIRMKTIHDELLIQAKKYQEIIKSSTTYEVKQDAAKAISIIEKITQRIDPPKKQLYMESEKAKLKDGERYTFGADPTPIWHVRKPEDYERLRVGDAYSLDGHPGKYIKEAPRGR